MRPCLFQAAHARRELSGKGSSTMKYRHIATSLEGFVQHLATNILPHGYWFYVMGFVPDRKTPESIDEKLITKYNVALSRQQRARRKLTGAANVHYLRLGRGWILLATHGQHRFLEEERENIRDARKIPIQIGGYSLSVKRGGFLQKDSPDAEPVPDGKHRVRVQISRERYRELCGYFLERASHRSVENLSKELYCIPFEPYAPVRRQLLNLLRLINQKRQASGFEKLSPSVLRYKRHIVSPFEEYVEEEAREGEGTISVPLIAGYSGMIPSSPQPGQLMRRS